ncbi:MAG: protein translocase subunit SecD [Calditerrivibrio sp.]|nr:protein translocase subunit SecD [Calditerrivibrio sp.]MCA1979930.1 protein translocase subunit SecD [Calditerrivibrio sp.]
MQLKLRWITIAIIFLVALFFMFPLEKRIKLGLDLKGGMHIVLGVETEKAVQAKIDTVTSQIRKELRSNKFNFSYVQKNDSGKILIGVTDTNERKKITETLSKNYPFLKESGITSDEKIIELSLDTDEVKRIKDYAVEQAVQVIRNRVDQFGVSEPVIQRQGENQILVQLAGISDSERAVNLIGKTAQLKFHLVDEAANNEESIKSGNIPADSVILYSKVIDKISGKITSKIPYVLKKDAVLTGDYLVEAEVRISSQFNEPYVSIKFDPAGSKIFEDITGENVNKRMAIVLDDNVYSAPTIREKISGGEAQISGSFTLEEAKDLAIVLRAGSLPAPVKILENRTIGPSLGKDSINKGLIAALIGVSAVVIFMLIYYKFSGLIASIALLSNSILILGAMGMFNATLTLPGIAGLILTMGMAIDANVLIFERVREELRIGRTPLNALEAGYEKAMSTIVDSNITTLIAGVVLFQFGTGPVKGFAVILSIGILSSIFTAVTLSKTIFMTLYANKDVKELSI